MQTENFSSSCSSFSCLFALAKTSSTTLNRHGESKYPDLVLKGKAFNFHC